MATGIPFPFILAAKKVRNAVYYNACKSKAKSGNLWHEKEFNFFASRHCNARCPHCYLLQKDNNVFQNQYLSLEHVEKIIDKYPAFKRINLSGGEALLNPDIMKIIDFCISKGKELQILTNAILLTKKADALMNLNIENLHISLDASSSEEFAFKRGLNKSGHSTLFADILDNIKKITGCKQKRIKRIGVSFIVDISNYNKIFEYISIAESLKVDYAYFTNYHSTDPEHKVSLFSHDTNIRALLDTVCKRNNYTIDIHLPILYGNNPGYYCDSLFSQVTMDSEGNLAPCCHINPASHYGNVFLGSEGNHVDGNKHPWNSDPIRSFRKNFLFSNEVPSICVLCKNRFRYQMSFNSISGKWYKNQQY